MSTRMCYHRVGKWLKNNTFDPYIKSWKHEKNTLKMYGSARKFDDQNNEFKSSIKTDGECNNFFFIFFGLCYSKIAK